MLYLLEVINAAIVSLLAFHRPYPWTVKNWKRSPASANGCAAGWLIKIGFLTQPPLLKHNRLSTESV